MKKINQSKVVVSLLLVGLYIFSCNSLMTESSSQDQESREFSTLKTSAIGPITIDDTDPSKNWSKTANDYGWCSGSGKWQDPYIIKNITVNAGGGAYGILIKNSKVYFTIRNCTVHDAIIGDISLNNVGNGTIVNNTCTDTSDYVKGIELWTNCDNNTIVNNTISNIGDGIEIRTGSDNNKIISNQANGNSRNGMILTGNCQNNIFLDNIASNNRGEHTNPLLREGYGMEISGCINNEFINNTFNDNYQMGVFLDANSDNNNFTGNLAYSNNDYGIYIGNANCGSNLFIRNNFSNNGINQGLELSTSNSWNDTEIGNSWSDYAGEDKNDDGIGDTPYQVNGVNDYKPILNDGDDIKPIIEILAPESNVLFGKISPTFSLSIIEKNIDETWYNLNNGVNQSFTGLTGKINQALWSSQSDGFVNLKFFVNDTTDKTNSTQIAVRKDTIAPNITILAPANNSIFGETPPTINVSISETSLDKSWYVLNDIQVFFTGTLFNISKDLWEKLSNETITVVFYANDTVGNTGWRRITLTKQIDNSSEDDNNEEDENEDKNDGITILSYNPLVLCVSILIMIPIIGHHIKKKSN